MKRILAILSVGFTIGLWGCGGGGGAPDTNPPTIVNVQVEPTKLTRFTGGEVTISAQVSDPSGVAIVWAEVQKPNGAMEKVTMSLTGNVYQGTIKAGANTRNDGQDETYKVWVRAKDAKGNETPEPGEPPGGISFTVPALIPPPERPDL